MDRKPLPSTIFYPEDTVRQAHHKLCHLRNDIKLFEHPQDQADLQSIIDRLEPLVAPHVERGTTVLSVDAMKANATLPASTPATTPSKSSKTTKTDQEA
jgi:hypothetical protein